MSGALAELRPETVTDLWAAARALRAEAEQEGTPVPLRRALVCAAIAGSGGAPAEFTALVAELHRAALRLALDPIPLFDAASGLVADGDHPAREALVTYPRRPPAERRLDQVAARELDSRLRGAD